MTKLAQSWLSLLVPKGHCPVVRVPWVQIEDCSQCFEFLPEHGQGSQGKWESVSGQGVRDISSSLLGLSEDALDTLMSHIPDLSPYY